MEVGAKGCKRIVRVTGLRKGTATPPPEGGLLTATYAGVGCLAVTSGWPWFVGSPAPDLGLILGP